MNLSDILQDLAILVLFINAALTNKNVYNLSIRVAKAWLVLKSEVGSQL